MKKIRIPLLLVTVAAVMMVFFTDRGNFNYRYQVGSPWNYENLNATFDFPILKTPEQLKQEREQKQANTLDCYRYDENVINQVLKAFDGFVPDSLQAPVNDALRGIYASGVVSSFNSDATMIGIKKDIKTPLTQTPASNIYTTAEAYTEFRKAAKEALPEVNVDSLLKRSNLSEAIVPNIYFDAHETEKLAWDEMGRISLTSGMVHSGDKIVSRGEVVTNETARILDSYKAELISAYGGSAQSGYLVRLSHMGIVLILLAIYALMLYVTDRSFYSDFRRLAFLMLLYTLVYVAIAVFPASNEPILYLMPFSLFILYTREFFRNRYCLALYLAALLPMLALRDNGVELYLMNALAGALLLISYKYFNRGLQQFANSVLMFIALLLVYFSFRLMSGTMPHRIEILFLALNSLLVVIGYPFVFLFERVFSLVSQMRLWELSDTNNALLQDLSRKAPGSFQHSLSVANLAEAGCRAIGGNTRLVRVGALYHDIGKIENPLCFTENQISGENYHMNLTPEQSARDIIRHVTDGVALARRNSLPEQVVDMIASHHGTTKTMYFYTKYCNEGGDPSNTEPFTYQGKLPKSKEEVVLMFADSVEAASRSLSDYSQQSISALVNRIIDGKISEGQIAKGDITLGEIDKLKQVFTENLQQIYHGRIAYPKAKKPLKQSAS